MNPKFLNHTVRQSHGFARKAMGFKGTHLLKGPDVRIIFDFWATLSLTPSVGALDFQAKKKRLNIFTRETEGLRKHRFGAFYMIGPERQSAVSKLSKQLHLWGSLAVPRLPTESVRHVLQRVAK